jgi:chemotaxis-related protein WspD
VTQPGDPQCWRAIGVDGDGSCPRLADVIHCRNCPVFTAAGRELMERPAPAGYAAEWTGFLAGAKVRGAARNLAVLIFRIGDEWLALDATEVTEIAEARPVHRIAHRSGPVLTGLVNIRGQLLLQVSLHGLIGIERPPRRPDERRLDRLVVLGGEQAWVFSADEVHGVQRFAATELAALPVTIGHGVAGVSRGLLVHGERRLGYLDGDVLRARLRQAVG